MFDWYKIFNLSEFLDLELTSVLYSMTLVGIGQKDILVTNGNYTSIAFDDVFLPINLNDKNPFSFEGYAIYIDDETSDVFLGVAVEN